MRRRPGIVRGNQEVVGAQYRGMAGEVIEEGLDGPGTVLKTQDNQLLVCSFSGIPPVGADSMDLGGGKSCPDLLLVFPGLEQDPSQGLAQPIYVLGIRRIAQERGEGGTRVGMTAADNDICRVNARQPASHFPNLPGLLPVQHQQIGGNQTQAQTPRAEDKSPGMERRGDGPGRFLTLSVAVQVNGDMGGDICFAATNLHYKPFFSMS